MNQRVIVTAGASGIGREIARAFVAAGAAVFVCGGDAKALEALRRDVSGVKTALSDVSKRQHVFLASESAKSTSGQMLRKTTNSVPGVRTRSTPGCVRRTQA